MNERSAFDILLDYAKEKGFDFDTNKTSKHFIVPGDPLLNTKYVVFKKEDVYFVAHDSYAAKAYLSKTFSGVYSVIDIKQDFECKIYKKDWLDKFLRKNRVKAGSKLIDDNLTITSDSRRFIPGLISDRHVKLFLELSDRITPIELLIQYNYLPFIRGLDKKRIIGLETNNWLYRNEDLDSLLNLGGELIENINRRQKA